MMNTLPIVQRDIQEKWAVKNSINTAVLQVNDLLPAGNWKKFDPFLLMGESIMKKGAFDYHPHRGIETVSYMIDGELIHYDNKGGRGTLHQGDTQWMTAGKGLLHLEDAPDGGFAHLLQLWVNLPAENKMAEPRYQDIFKSDTPVRKEEGAEIKVISGTSGNVTSATKNYAHVTLVEVTVAAGHTVTQDLPADYNGFIYVLQGAGVFGANEVKGTQKEVLWLSSSVYDASEISIRATEPLKLLVIAGKPLREPVVASGPIVMNTQEQVAQAFKDYREGKFGEWIANTHQSSDFNL